MNWGEACQVWGPRPRRVGGTGRRIREVKPWGTILLP